MKKSITILFSILIVILLMIGSFMVGSNLEKDKKDKTKEETKQEELTKTEEKIHFDFNDFVFAGAGDGNLIDTMDFNKDVILASDIDDTGILAVIMSPKLISNGSVCGGMPEEEIQKGKFYTKAELKEIWEETFGPNLNDKFEKMFEKPVSFFYKYDNDKYAAYGMCGMYAPHNELYIDPMYEKVEDKLYVNAIINNWEFQPGLSTYSKPNYRFIFKLNKDNYYFYGIEKISS